MFFCYAAVLLDITHEENRFAEGTVNVSTHFIYTLKHLSSSVRLPRNQRV